MSEANDEHRVHVHRVVTDNTTMLSKLNLCGVRVSKQIARVFALKKYEKFARNCYSTIFALSSGLQPRGNAIAIIRVSGPETIDVIDGLTRGKSQKMLAKTRTAVLCSLYDPQTNDLIDKAIVIYFPSASSYTGEDLCELHVHGSHAVVSSLLEVIGKFNGCRPSEAGEFTKRAFLNGKIDLTEAEGISHLIAAQTTAQRRNALKAVTGVLTQHYDNWRRTLLEIIAYLEANIDFSEDQLLDEEMLNGVVKKATSLKDEINTFLTETTKKSERIIHGLEIAIMGEPNVGKSSLINKLCQRQVSIVSPISGTTRDIVETHLDVGGYAVRICDTAGIKDLSAPLTDVIEEEGIKRAITRAQSVDLIIYVIDGSKDDIETAIENSQKHSQIMKNAACIIFVVNKMDLISDKMVKMWKENKSKQNICILSCKTSEGFEDFIDILTKNIDTLCGQSLNEEAIFSTERHKTHLYKVSENIESGLSHYKKDLAISAHYFREACKELSFITGRISTEDILDVIFKDFCIGK
ncbi:tRNA modification GTPase MnmE-like protein [Dinothrombium tinctorium]|uniref:tRNA modification GTPase MnmE-like protein n=1 Tax=Dinothrombium tinctorium TaxID=1965070 RepID=A0A3S3NNT2_9ACAR|nr:tRNA modification GTPase MnmE-like protein [Dinothrombium tinctorium]RWS02789.1 tRNA modification GTPase MnmE-like protein [Dinothrombium tinctorium]RWS06325.1 tRNA modification GTPase MnmE-like protein [Dinothrombium tinctorium]